MQALSDKGKICRWANGFHDLGRGRRASLLPFLEGGRQRAHDVVGTSRQHGAYGSKLADARCLSRGTVRKQVR